jgi:hypothetical protein
MKVPGSLARIVTLALCFFGNLPLSAQTIKKWTAADIVAKAKSGQWVDIDGVIQKDRSVHALEVEFLTGDFIDDDWELNAKVEAVNQQENEFQVLSLPVKISKTTQFNKGIKSLAEITPGMLVELEGTYLKDGVFMAKEVENKTDRLKAKPQLETIIEAIGQVGQVDEAKRIITVMGIQFHVTEKTEGKSPIN